MEVWNTFPGPCLCSRDVEMKGRDLCQCRRGVPHLSSFVRNMCCKEVARSGHNFWPRLLIMGCCSLPCKANEVCDQTELPVNALPLNYLCLSNWCIVTLIKPKSYFLLFKCYWKSLFSFYFQVSVLFWDNFASSLLVIFIFSKLEFFLLMRQQGVYQHLVGLY